jgi:hypothetical protein
VVLVWSGDESPGNVFGFGLCVAQLGGGRRFVVVPVTEEVRKWPWLR